MINEKNNDSAKNDSVVIFGILTIGAITITHLLKDIISEISISDTSFNLKTN